MVYVQVSLTSIVWVWCYMERLEVYHHSGYKDTINLLYFGDAQNGIYDYVQILQAEF